MTALLLAAIWMPPHWYKPTLPCDPIADSKCFCEAEQVISFDGVRGRCADDKPIPGRCPVCGAKGVEAGRLTLDCIGVCADCVGCGPPQLQVNRCPHDGLLFTEPEAK